METTTTPPPARKYAGYQYQCVTCEIGIEGKPTFHLGLAFCCAGCAVSGPCTCSYDDRPSAAQMKAAAQLCACHRVAESDAIDQRHRFGEPLAALARR